MKEMFEASVDGQSYDTERWGQYFRPAGLSAPVASGSTSAAAADDDEPFVTTPKVTSAAKPTSSFDDEDDVPVASAPVSTPAPSSDKAQDILAQIRARQKA
jgi:hypothetical protein